MTQAAATPSAEEKTIEELIAELPHHELEVDEDGWILVNTEDDLLSILRDTRQLFLLCEELYGAEGFELIQDEEGKTLQGMGLTAQDGLFFVDKVPGTHWYINSWGVIHHSAALAATEEHKAHSERASRMKVQGIDITDKTTCERALCALIGLRT